MTPHWDHFLLVILAGLFGFFGLGFLPIFISSCGLGGMRPSAVIRFTAGCGTSASRLSGLLGMVVIKLHPTSKKVKQDQDTFLRLIGECVTRWAFIDRAVFQIFHQTLATDDALAATAYYKWNTLNQKCDLTDRTLAQKYRPDSPILKSGTR
jgi:hypothetical protein